MSKVTRRGRRQDPYATAASNRKQNRRAWFSYVSSAVKKTGTWFLGLEQEDGAGQPGEPEEVCSSFGETDREQNNNHDEMRALSDTGRQSNSESRDEDMPTAASIAPGSQQSIQKTRISFSTPPKFGKPLPSFSATETLPESTLHDADGENDPFLRPRFRFSPDSNIVRKTDPCPRGAAGPLTEGFLESVTSTSLIQAPAAAASREKMTGSPAFVKPLAVPAHVQHATPIDVARFISRMGSSDRARRRQQLQMKKSSCQQLQQPHLSLAKNTAIANDSAFGTPFRRGDGGQSAVFESPMFDASALFSPAIESKPNGPFSRIRDEYPPSAAVGAMLAGKEHPTSETLSQHPTSETLSRLQFPNSSFQHERGSSLPPLPWSGSRSLHRTSVDSTHLKRDRSPPRLPPAAPEWKPEADPARRLFSRERKIQSAEETAAANHDGNEDRVSGGKRVLSPESSFSSSQSHRPPASKRRSLLEHSFLRTPRQSAVPARDTVKKILNIIKETSSPLTDARRTPVPHIFSARSSIQRKRPPFSRPAMPVSAAKTSQITSQKDHQDAAGTKSTKAKFPQIKTQEAGSPTIWKSAPAPSAATAQNGEGDSDLAPGQENDDSSCSSISLSDPDDKEQESVQKQEPGKAPKSLGLSQNESAQPQFSFGEPKEEDDLRNGGDNPAPSSAVFTFDGEVAPSVPLLDTKKEVKSVTFSDSSSGNADRSGMSTTASSTSPFLSSTAVNTPASSSFFAPSIFGSSTAASSSNAPGTASPSSKTQATLPVFNFGATASTSAMQTTSSSTASVTSFRNTDELKPAVSAPSFVFGNSAVAGTFSSGEAVPPVAPSFSFGNTDALKPASASASASSTSFSFGSTDAFRPTSASASTPMAPSFSFGSTDAFKPPSTSAIASASASGSSTSFSFGSTDAFKPPSASASAPSTFSFGSTDAFKPTSAPAIASSSSGQATSAAADVTGSFAPPSQASSTDAPASFTAFSGAGAGAGSGLSSSASSGFSFGGPSLPQPAASISAAAPVFCFGAPSSSATGSTASAPSSTIPQFSFGASQASTTVSAGSAPFGASLSSSASTGAVAPSFTFGGASTPFGASSSSSFSFGTPAPTQPTQGLMSPEGMMDDSAASSAPIASSFGSSAPAAPGPVAFSFGASTTAQASMFGAAASSPATGSIPFTFGAAPAGGAPPSAQASAPPPFSFGAPQTASGPAGSFPFGSSTPAPSSGGGFSFGAPPPGGQGAFNFAAPSSGAPAFNFTASAPTPSFGAGAPPGGAAPFQFGATGAPAGVAQAVPGQGQTPRRKIVKARRPR